MNTVTLSKTEYEELLKSKEKFEELLELSQKFSSKNNKKFDNSAFGTFKKKQTRGQEYETRFRKLFDKEMAEDLTKLDW